MRALRRFLFVLIFASPIAALFGADTFNQMAGYGNTIWGMTCDDVLKVEPRAVRLKEPVKYQNADGLAEIRNIEISSANFSVTFMFDATGRRLCQVNIVGDEKKNAAINISRFRELQKLLTEKYGPPTYKTDLSPHQEGNHTVSWKFEKTKIELTHLYIPSVLTHLIVSYVPTGAKNDAKDL